MGGLDWYISSFFLVSTNAWLNHFSKMLLCLFTLKQFWSLLVTPSFSLIPLSPLCLLTFDTYNPQPTFSTFVDIVVCCIFGMDSSTWCHVYSLKSLRITNMNLKWFPKSKYPIYLKHYMVSRKLCPWPPTYINLWIPPSLITINNSLFPLFLFLHFPTQFHMYLFSHFSFFPPS